MPRNTTQSCDICFADITDPRKRYGLTVIIGHTRAARSHRLDRVNWTGEVCKSCHERCGGHIADAFEQTFAEIRAAAQPEVVDLPDARARQRRLIYGESIWTRLFNIMHRKDSQQ